MQITEILEVVGVAVIAGTAVTDQNFTRCVGELCQPDRGSSNCWREAEDRFFSVHGPNWAAETQPRRFSADLHMLVVPCDIEDTLVANRARTWSGGYQAPSDVLGWRPAAERIRSPRRICWGALSQCSLLPTSCNTGGEGEERREGWNVERETFGADNELGEGHRHRIRQVSGATGFL